MGAAVVSQLSRAGRGDNNLFIVSKSPSQQFVVTGPLLIMEKCPILMSGGE